MSLDHYLSSRCSRYLRLPLLFSALLFLHACGPSIGSSIVLPQLRPVVPPGSELAGSSYENFVFIEELVDARVDTGIAELDGRSIRSTDNVVPVVLQGLRTALGDKGFKFSDTAPILLLGEIRVWKAEIEGGFSSSVSANAELYIQVLDPANKRIYSGSYKGFASAESPRLGVKQIRNTLGIAMSEAIVQVVKDQQLVRLLSSF
jgi:hypothetical protein